jgi:hypothetical protein
MHNGVDGYRFGRHRDGCYQGARSSLGARRAAGDARDVRQLVEVVRDRREKAAQLVGLGQRLTGRELSFAPRYPTAAELIAGER